MIRAALVRRSRARGFTLVEALVAMSIVALVMVAIGLIGRDVFALRSGFSAALSTQSDARRILRPFADEVRAARHSELGAYPIAESATSSVTFYADVDRDGVAERVRYVVEDGELRKAVSEPSGDPLAYGPAATTTLVRGLLASSTAFTYYGAGYDGAASSSALAFPVSPVEVRGVRVSIEVDPDPIRPPGAALLTTFATVRNLRGGGE